MYKAIENLASSLPRGAFRSITSHRDKEFACYEDVKKSW